MAKSWDCHSKGVGDRKGSREQAAREMEAGLDKSM